MHILIVLIIEDGGVGVRANLLFICIDWGKKLKEKCAYKQIAWGNEGVLEIE